ncbi:hypothetical protein [Cellulosilyticum sp. WCF-2]|uniref:hypothetical protein n=1 Tax=Cellulosilyticum sp. WCF-2 TaxID=2497860 RepID=UPI000F8CAB66|nr:hypothetical protein [Cellulosilyticum sp. WCF-2]QEH68700.1 hypothetical protein EKH84_10045 [Cellulosilyticum sp. WCF-2]
MATMTKNISVTNAKVRTALIESINASELVEVAVLYFLGEISKEYIDNYKDLQEITIKLEKARG